jgi:RNA polymerase sigma factor (sigma-70 family)
MNNPGSMPDEQLIRFYLHGETNAMATLVELYKDRVYASIYNMVQDKYAAEEIFRDVFIRAINNMVAGNIPAEGNFLEWATRIAQKMCMEHSRKSIHTASLKTPAEPAHFNLPAALPDTGYHENHHKIKSMINMLPDDQREVMVLNHYGGMGFKEIAGVMKCSLNNALDRMKFGLNNLCKLMTEKEIVLN